MGKYKATYYKKLGSIWFVSGGKLIITENEYIIKYFFKTVARFEIDKTIVTRIPRDVLYKGIYLWDGVKGIELYFFSKTVNKLYKILNV